MIEKISITELKEEADKIREKEEHETDMGELNYVTSYNTIQIWW